MSETKRKGIPLETTGDGVQGSFMVIHSFMVSFVAPAEGLLGDRGEGGEAVQHLLHRCAADHTRPTPRVSLVFKNTSRESSQACLGDGLEGLEGLEFQGSFVQICTAMCQSKGGPTCETFVWLSEGNVDPLFINPGFLTGGVPEFSLESDHFWRGTPPYS